MQDQRSPQRHLSEDPSNELQGLEARGVPKGRRLKIHVQTCGFSRPLPCTQHPNLVSVTTEMDEREPDTAWALDVCPADEASQ